MMRLKFVNITILVARILEHAGFIYLLLIFIFIFSNSGIILAGHLTSAKP